MASHVFCHDLCLERGEPLAGTGDAPRRVLMLAWPRGKWRTPRWESVDMSPELAKTVHEAVKKGLHVALVDRVGDSETLPRLMAQPEAIYADFDNELDLMRAVADYADGKIFAGRPDPRPTIIVCTDSRRDACCARYGFSTYKALVAVADPARFHIVQATHIGGCRFAASLVVMPHRQRYGRMTAGQVPAFLEALSRGEVFLPAYKGRTDEPEPVQVAELAALQWAAEHHIAPVRVTLVHDALPDAADDGDEIAFVAELSESRLDIVVRAQTFHIQGNCNVVANGGGTHEVRWCLTRLSKAS